MKKALLLVALLAFTQVAGAGTGKFDGIYKKLRTICVAHPEFHASSIDFFDPKKAPEYQVEFYKLVEQLHPVPAAIDYFLAERKRSGPKGGQCIDNILNTWPG